MTDGKATAWSVVWMVVVEGRKWFPSGGRAQHEEGAGGMRTGEEGAGA